MSEALNSVVAVFLDDFYGGMDWRTALDGDRLVLDAEIESSEGKTIAVSFVDDGVRQVAPPGPFDAIACAEVLSAGFGKSR